MPKLSKAFPFSIGAGKQNGILSNTIGLSNNMLAAGNALRNGVARLTAKRRTQPKVKLLSIYYKLYYFTRIFFVFF